MTHHMAVLVTKSILAQAQHEYKRGGGCIGLRLLSALPDCLTHATVELSSLNTRTSDFRIIESASLPVVSG